MFGLKGKLLVINDRNPAHLSVKTLRWSFLLSPCVFACNAPIFCCRLWSLDELVRAYANLVINFQFDELKSLTAVVVKPYPTIREDDCARLAELDDFTK
jgi:hypothetical protein